MLVMFLRMHDKCFQPLLFCVLRANSPKLCIPLLAMQVSTLRAPFISPSISATGHVWLFADTIDLSLLVITYWLANFYQLPEVPQKEP